MTFPKRQFEQIEKSDLWKIKNIYYVLKVKNIKFKNALLTAKLETNKKNVIRQTEDRRPG